METLVKRREIYPLTRQFIDTCLTLQPEYSISLGLLYDLYYMFCVEARRKPAQSKRVFIKELREVLKDEIQSGSIIIDNRSAVVLRGVSPKGGMDGNEAGSEVSKELAVVN